MADDIGIAAGNINRNIAVFLSDEDQNGIINDVHEASNYAEEIKKFLEGKSGHPGWIEKYGAENLEAWQKQFAWLAEPSNFELYKNWHYEGEILRNYLMARHFYQDPTRHVVETAPENCKDSTSCYGTTAQTEIYKTYEMPPLVEIENAILTLCKTTGGAEKAIAFIEKLKETYPGQFYGGINEVFGINPSTEFFSGKNPQQLAFGLNCVAELIGRKDIISFIKKIDDILGWSFSFQKTPAYLRFHDIWLEKGEALFVELRQRREITDFFKEQGFAEKLDEKIMDIFVHDMELFRELKKLIGNSDNYKTFARMIRNDEELNQSGGENFTQRLEDFLTLLKKRGGDFFKDVHKASHIPHVPKLMLVPYYRLADTIMDEGGDIKQILPMFSEAFLKEEQDADHYWSYDNYAYILAWSSFLGILTRMAFPKTLAVPIVELHNRGVLKQKLEETKLGFKEFEDMQIVLNDTFDRLKIHKNKPSSFETNFAVVLAFLGKETMPANCPVHSVGCEIVDSKMKEVDIDSKLFWSILATTAGSHVNFASDKWNSFASNTIQRHYSPYISKYPKPSDEDLKRLDIWLEKASKHFNLPRAEYAIRTNDRTANLFKRYVLKQMILSQNGKVPSDKELEIFDREVLASGLAEQAGKKIYITMYFYAASLGDLWEKAPQITRALSKAVIASVPDDDFSTGSETYKFREAFKNIELRNKLAEIEKELNGMEKEKRELFLSTFLEKIGWNFKDNSPERIIFKLEAMRLFFKENEKDVTEFMSLCVGRKFVSFKAFSALFEHFKENGADALKETFDQWKIIGLSTEEFYGNKRLLKLSERDIGRAMELEKLFAKNGRGLFYVLPDVLDLEETPYQNWLSFIKELLKHEIYLPVPTVLNVRTIPNILPLLILLKEEGILDRTLNPPHARYSQEFIENAFEVFSKRSLPLLAENLEETKRIIRKFEKRFNGYLFDEFTEVMIMPRSPIMLIPTLADIVNFEVKVKEDFFKSRREVQNIYDDYTTIVSGTLADTGEHPFIDDDPNNPFKLTDYSLYRYALNNRTYPTALGGMSREDIIENLTAQFTKMDVKVRKENKNYGAREYASRDILESLPLAELMKIQWMLNNLRSADFTKEVAGLLEKDFADPLTEYGGFIMQKGGRPEVPSLFEPMALMPMPSGDLKSKREVVELLDSEISSTLDKKELERLQKVRRAILAQFDGAYAMPESMIDSRFGWQMGFHLHSTSEDAGNSENYSGPSGGSGSGGDIETTYELGDSVVFTRLGPNKFNADIYGVIPHTNEEQVTTWTEFVIDLGVYTTTP